MGTKTTEIIIATMLVSSLAAANLAMADGGVMGWSKKRAAVQIPPTSTRFEAELQPSPANAGQGLEGEAEYLKRTRPQGTQERFGAQVEVKIPNTLGIDESTPSIILDLSRGGTSYARCTLEFTGVEQGREHGQLVRKVEFRVALEQNTPISGPLPSVKEIFGTCGGILPAVELSDMADVPDAATSILTGTFKQD